MMFAATACLAMAVYYEARSEPIHAQAAVAEVVINRMHHPDYPDTICDVIADDRGPKPYDCQFSFMCDGKHERPNNPQAYQTALEVASEVLAGNIMGHRATHYHTTAVKPVWRHGLTPVGTIGSHIFYTDGSCFLAMGCSPRPKARPEGLAQ